jgi:ribosomal protein S18 acetylase RimI-like enzyme
MIRCDDWRLVASAAVEPLLERERDAWLRDLEWDVAAAWQGVEPARRAGALPGFVATDAGGRIVGWTSFLLHRGNVQVLAFVASSSAAATALLGGILESDEGAAAEAVLFCVRSVSDELPKALASRGFRVEPYRYLVADLRPITTVQNGLRCWSDEGDRLPTLLARAYEDESTTRAFAPHGTSEEWIDYVVALLTTTGCGRFMPGLSFVAPAPDGRELDGAVVVTDLAPGTSHVAQIAVDPKARGRGLGRHLLDRAMSAAAAAGYARMTLLVAASNRAALSLYTRAGFLDRSTFIVAMAERRAISTALRIDVSPRTVIASVDGQRSLL